MNPKSTVRKKCLECGYIYDDAEMMFGIKRCPNDQCFKVERFVYVDANGKEKPQYAPHESSADKDEACLYASLYLDVPREILTCTNDCPFKPDCVDWLDKPRLSHLKRLFVKMSKIKMTYNMRDKNILVRNIADVLEVPVDTVSFWLSRRRYYEPIINNGDISQDLEKSRGIPKN